MAVPWTGNFMLEQRLLRQLIHDAKAGDAAAFERLVILHERMVLRTAQRLLSNNEDAKDAAQEVFVRLHRHLGRFQDDKHVAPWLYRITVNTCHDIRRRAKPDVSIDQALEALDKLPNPEQSLSQAQQRSLITAALDRLTERERAAIVLRDFEGQTTEQIAQLFGSSQTTVRSQLSTGRSKLRKFVIEHLRRQS